MGGSSSSPCKSVVLWSSGLHEYCMTQRCMAQQCMTVWSLECDLTLATTTLMLTQITQSPSSAAQQLRLPCTDVASVDSPQPGHCSSQHRQCQAPSTQVASMCSDRSTSTVQYSTVHSTQCSTVQYSTVQCIVSWPHFTMSTVPHCRPSTSLHPEHVCVLC